MTTKATTMADLAFMCKSWNGADNGTFANAVATYLALTGTSQRVLADEFEAAISTVSRWASGEVKPRPRMQKLIVATIGKWAQKASDATAKVEPEPAKRLSRSSGVMPVAAAPMFGKSK